MIFEQVKNDKKLTSLSACFHAKLISKKNLDALKFKKKLEGLLGKNKTEYQNIEAVHKQFCFGGEEIITFSSFFYTMYQYLCENNSKELKGVDLRESIDTLKEVYVAKDIPQGKTINDIIKQKKMTKKFQKGNILSKTAFKTEFVDIVLPSLAKKVAKRSTTAI